MSWPGAVLVPPVSLEGGSGVLRRRDPKSAGLRFQPQVVGRRLKAGQSKETSWWTARATAGEVRPQVSRRKRSCGSREQDPRAEGGMFARLEELLGALAGPRVTL